MNESDEEYELRARKRFWAKVDVRGPDECWEWQASVLQSGYGSFGYRRRSVYAHRFARGAPEPTPGLDVCHSCGNRLCCNPNHLRLGSRAENERDKIAHGTAVRGEKHVGSRLTEADVRAIRRARAAGGVTQQELAEKYGISRSLVSMIADRKRWKHI